MKCSYELLCRLLLSLLDQPVHCLGFSDHFSHLCIGRVLINDDPLLRAVRLLGYDDLHYVVFVNVELYFDLLGALRAGSNVLDPNGANFNVLRRLLVLSLKNFDEHLLLVVPGGRESFRLFEGDCDVPIDNLLHFILIPVYA